MDSQTIQRLTGEITYLNANHHKLLGLFIVTLMLSGIIPLAFIQIADAKPEMQFTSSEITWETLNRNMNVTTFVGPDGSRDELWHFLSSAQESIYVEIYGINNPYILDHIYTLRDANPSLDIKVLMGWESLGYMEPYLPNPYVAYNLTQEGVPFRWTSDTEFTYAHQKFVIIDNKTTIVHSGNWAKTSFPEAGKKANREWSIAMTDVEVTAVYRWVFDYDWQNGVAYDEVRDGTGSPLSYTQSGSSYPRPFSTPGEFSGPMNVTPIFSPVTSLQGILYCINSARATLDIQIAYFTSVGDGGEVDQVIDAIIAAKNRGVTVRVITEENAKPDIEDVVIEFETHGIPVVYQYETWFTAMHNKGIIVDGRLVLISSINYSDGSIGENREAGVIIENKEVAQWYLDVFDYDWKLGEIANSDEVNLDWNPNIPASDADITVTVYAHMLNNTGDVEEVKLGVKIADGQWTNHTITSSVYTTPQNYQDTTANYDYVIPQQADGTNITVKAYVEWTNGTHTIWHESMERVIRVRDSLGSIPPPTTTPPPPPPPDGIVALLAEYGIYIIAAVAALVLAVVFRRR
ncbi:MAG: phosphatidylserine/phosphatidylglycerophosphate/cardiolipin synthase family protein [Candidatus Thorarchaeota archaeon]